MDAQLTQLLDYLWVRILSFVVVWFWLGFAYEFMKIFLDQLQKKAKNILQNFEKVSSKKVESGVTIEYLKEKLPEAVEEFFEMTLKGLNDFYEGLRKVSWALLEPAVGDENENRGSVRSISDLSSIEFQRIAGALLEFILLLAFLYADAALAAQAHSALVGDSVLRIPAWLNHFIIPLIVASSGSALILGIFLADSVGLTHLSVWENLSAKRYKIILRSIVVTMLIWIILSAGFISAYRAEVLYSGKAPQFVERVAYYAQNLIVVPLLVTTAMLIRGFFGFFAILSLFLYVVALPVRLVKRPLRWLSFLLKNGIITSEFLFSQALKGSLFSFMLLSDILQSIVKMIYFASIALLSVIFYVPYLSLNILVKKAGFAESIQDFVAPMFPPDPDFELKPMNKEPVQDDD